MKRTLCITAFVVSLVGCGQQGSSESGSAAIAESSAPSQAPATNVSSTPAKVVRPPEEGQKLALHTVEVMEKIAPIVFEGSGVGGMPPSDFYPKVANPLSDLLNQWPVLGDQEKITWGDYGYCSDALLTLNGEALSQKSNAPHDKGKAKADFKRELGKCKEAVKIPPSEIGG